MTAGSRRYYQVAPVSTELEAAEGGAASPKMWPPFPGKERDP